MLTDREVMAFVRDNTALWNLLRDMREHLDKAPGSEHAEAAQALARYAEPLAQSIAERMRDFATRRGL